MRQIGEFLFSCILIALFYVVIGFDYVDAIVREAYYKLLGIPYYKRRGKFGPYVVRLHD